MNINVYVCAYVHMYIYVCVFSITTEEMCVHCASAEAQGRVYVMHVYMNVCIYMYVCVCIYIYMYVRVYTRS